MQIENEELSERVSMIERKFSFTEGVQQFNFKLNLSPANLMASNDSKLMIVVNGHKGISFKVFETTDKGLANKKQSLIYFQSDNGQLIFLTDKDFFTDPDWDEIKKQGVLYFTIAAEEKQIGEFSITYQIGESLNLQMGSNFLTKISPGIKNLSITESYDGQDKSYVEKIRFQISTLEKKVFGKIEGTISHQSNTYVMNTVFDNILGGVLDSNVLSLCTSKKCEYQFSLKIVDVSQFIIETFLVGQIEELSIYHQTEYYDRVFAENSTRIYNLPFVSDMEGLDVSISLIPVAGHTSLFVNPCTKPLDLEKYLFSVKGKLSKRITISWEELVSMQTQRQNLFIAVNSQDKGEFLIKLDAHESHYKGRLSPGYAEAGFVKYLDTAKYIVSFKPWDNQKINFTVKLQIISGNAELHIKKCKKETFCDISKKELEQTDSVTKGNSEFERSFTVNCKKESCNYLIAIQGWENRGTHFELMVQENKFHYLMLPGNSISLNLMPEQQKYLKFSYPGKKSQAEKLYLQVQPEWGSFTIYLDTKNEYPNEDANEFQFTFYADRHGLLDYHKNFQIEDLLGEHQGLIYVGLSSLTSCQVNLKFHSKTPDSISLHTLTAGKLQNGVILHAKDLHYYHIQLSLSDKTSSSVSIDLVPLRGKFVLVASREGRIPTLQQNDKISYDNKLELQYQVYDDHNEYIVGVFSQTGSKEEDLELNYEYKIGLSYSEKTNKLQPGIFMTHTMNDKNVYLIQIISEMDNLLILKTIIDGYNIQLCGVFDKNTVVEHESCDFESNDSQMGYFLTKEQLSSFCKKHLESQNTCFLSVHIEGIQDQIFSVGFTYNDLPFHLTQNNIITGPAVLKEGYSINFIFHPEKDKDCTFYFNAKGSKTRIMTLITDGTKQQSLQMLFPTYQTFDQDNLQTQGYVSVVNYTKEEIAQKGSSPEILITIAANQENSGDQKSPFDLINGFILQQFDDQIEITRTEIRNEHMFEMEDKYYYFYNNGSTGQITVYLNSNNAAFFEVSISRGRGLRPGIDSKVLKTKKGVNLVQLNLTKEELEGGDQNIKGYFTVQVRCLNRAYVSIYWNNKAELNFVDLNLNFPQTMHLETNKTLYFTFYVADSVDGNSKSKRIGTTLHYKADGEITIYLKKIEDKDLVIPNDLNKDFEGNLGLKGGIGYISIPYNDKNYCTNCSFVGAVSSSLSGQITLLANVEKANLPIQLASGFPFPDTLLSNQGKTYRYLNVSQEPFYLNVSMLSGFCNVHVGSKMDVSAENAKESFLLTLDNKTHSYLKIEVSKYESAMNFYILVDNPKLDPVSYTLSVFENNFHSPIEVGITKNVEVAANSQVDLFFVQQKDQSEFEVRFIVKNVGADDNEDNVRELFQQIDNLFSIGHLWHSEFQKLARTEQTVEENRVYITFSSPSSNDARFNIRIDNPLFFGLQVQIDILQGNYKLLNLNDVFVDTVNGSETKMYEAYGIAHRYWFFEMKMCFGEVSVEFFQDYKSMSTNKDPISTKLVSENNTMVYYMNIEKPQVYVKLMNKNSSNSIFKLVAYNAQDLDDNFYSEVGAPQDGKIQIDTARNRVFFEPVRIRNFNDDSYDHRVVYRVYLSPEFKMMRFAKNCGMHMIQKAWQDPKVQFNEVVFRYSGSKEFNRAEQVSIDLPILEKSQRYYAVVTAEIHLLTRGEGMIEPLRQSLTYYDEFIVVGGKAEIPVNLVVPLVAVVGLLIVLWYLINDYIFGEIRTFKDIREDLKEITENQIDVLSILESEFQAEEPAVKKKNVVVQRKNQEVEMRKKGDDMKAPLDLE